ncbi:MAG TPA: cytochrome c3 family protein [Candidatus Sulfotelmatobacter sp.]|nr:cytochrome c3 family protein [Candidatus Sulfotelmatobacter sp.]
MLAQINLVTRRPRGGVSLKPTEVTADVLRFGRSAGSEVLLSDLRVAVAEASLQLRDGVLYLTQLGTNPIRVNGAVVGSAVVKPGDEIHIGPYKIGIVEPPEAIDVAVTVELVTPLGDDFARLQTQSAIGLERTRLRKRTVAWVLSLTVLFVFVMLPVAGYLLNAKPDPRAATPTPRVVPTAVDEAWNVGEISNVHKNFWRECRACHEAIFTGVRDQACLACHTTVQHHVSVKRFPTLRINRAPCGGCHLEHRGAHGLITQAQELCTDCHENLKRAAANAELRDVTDFGAGHPEFRVTVVADAASRTFARVDLGTATPPVDHPNLKFSHKDHLDPVGWPRDMRKLACADCHVPDPGGGLMQPISFTKHCAECHASSLKFDAAAPDRAVPHGDALRAQRAIEEYYATVALQGGAIDPAAPEFVRRKPGTPLTEPQRLEALAWAKVRARGARDFVFDDRRGCGTCHEVDRGADPFKIAPVLVQTHFLPKAEFNHGKHLTIGCENCHAARRSTSSSDVLIPGIENCRACHGGETAWAKVRSTCISCHVFHKPGVGPMRPFTDAASEAAGE